MAGRLNYPYLFWKSLATSPKSFSGSSKILYSRIETKMRNFAKTGFKVVRERSQLVRCGKENFLYLFREDSGQTQNILNESSGG